MSMSSLSKPEQYTEQYFVGWGGVPESRRHVTIMVLLKLDEERYAEESGAAYEKAEREAQQSGRYPVVYAEPYRSIGCGFGPLNAYVRIQCSAVANELRLELAFCNHADLLVSLSGGSPKDCDGFVETLGERLQAVKTWIINRGPLWNEN